MVTRNIAKLACLAVVLGMIPVSSSIAITLNQVDDFQGGSTANWTSGGLVTPVNVADSGPAGVGDNALEVDTSNARAVVFNQEQWSGDWSAAGIERISLDIRAMDGNASDLTMWLGISAGGPPAVGGNGETFVTTESQTVPNDGQWHSVTFDATETDWTSIGGLDITTALTDVFQFRVIHNTSRSFIGSFGAEGFVMDNIRAVVPEPGALASSALACILATALRPGRRRRLDG